MKKVDLDVIINRIPIIGIVSFCGLYMYSTSLYPGGSQASLNSEGFDWVNNYWCNLMNENGMNGQPNPARPFSIVALTILSLSVMVFFLKFASTLAKSLFWQRIIKICGILSMISVMLIFTKYHDMMTIISSFFGFFVVIGIIKELYCSDMSFYKTSGVCCVFLLGINNYIYYSGNFIELLPLLQKITFFVVLLWIVGLNAKLIKMKEKSLN